MADFELETQALGYVPKGMGSHEAQVSGATNEWITPRWLTAHLGPFDLDPCAPVSPPWDIAQASYSILDDGLKQPWGGRVWLNPPYGPEAGEWLARLAEHDNGVALIFARTETKIWHEHVWPHAYAINFLRGRIAFCDVTGRMAPKTAGAPSALVAYGFNNVEPISRVDGQLVWPANRNGRQT